MAGTIELGDSSRWDVPSWAFNFVLDYLVRRLDGEPIAQELREVDEENVGFLNIGEFGPTVRIQVLSLLRDGLVADAEQRVPEDLPGRAGGIDRLKELADLAGAALRSNE